MLYCKSRIGWATLFAWGVVLLAPFPAALAVRCLDTVWGPPPTECEGSFCGASYYVLSTGGGAWVYKCINDIFYIGSCTHPYVLYKANHTKNGVLIRHSFEGCCTGDWCSNQTSALTMPPEYQEYLQTLKASSPVEPIPSSSVPELETGHTTSISPPESPISIILLPSGNIGKPGTKMTVVVQSSGGGDPTSTSDIATATSDVATATSDVATATSDVAPTCTDISSSTVLVQPSGQPPSSPSSGDMDYATLSFVLIILVCFLICVIVIMFVAMVIWWAVWYRRLANLTKVTEFKLQIE